MSAINTHAAFADVDDAAVPEDLPNAGGTEETSPEC